MVMKRSQEREQAFCLVFQSMFNSDSSLEIYEENIASVGEYARSVADGVSLKTDDLDNLIEKYSKCWKVKRLPKVNLAILRLAVYEILYVDEVPASVAINEAVELAKKYSGESDYSFINGVLGALVKGEAAE
ncbi:transcription antitermination factor NusB [uncultured Eubacterium sp.]|uniref:transcription antitermination factor NusB n=1 Tax=uncultured Eubacterium sp. TaxID=165185 RepID=UPI0028045DF1|nr:transcription antitermination factor NusB [uncultured Eubacterium sp.]